MNVLSLFSGIGGLDLGLERAGMTICGQVEIDPWCRKVLAKHWPEVPRHDDVRTCAEWWGGRAAPDLVCGGIPCQPVSVAGLKLAQEDPRWLWPAMADTVRALRPRFVLVENVPGLLARGMGDILRDLAACGYDADWDCIPASAVGAPHQRDRVWIIAHTQVAGCEARRGNGLRTLTGARQGSPPRPTSAPVADTERQRSELRQTPGEQPGRPASGRPAMADAERDGLEGPGQSALTRQGAAVLRRRPPRPGRWATEPDVGRVAHGIPRRVDRLRGLGNAVVPQVAEHIGRLIMEAAA